MENHFADYKSTISIFSRNIGTLQKFNKAVTKFRTSSKSGKCIDFDMCYEIYGLKTSINIEE